MSLKKFIDPITNVTSLASINSYNFIGKGDKNAADQAAVDSMRKELNNIPFEKLGYFNNGLFKIGKETTQIDELKKIFDNGLDELIN